MHSPSRPASRKASKRSWGYSPDLSMARARGLTFSWASRRAEDWSAASTSEREKSTGAGYRTAPPCIFWYLSPDDAPPEASTTAPLEGPDVDLAPRPDVQKRLKKARRKAMRRKHRWRRRILYTLSFIIFIAAAGAG